MRRFLSGLRRACAAALWLGAFWLGALWLGAAAALPLMVGELRAALPAQFVRAAYGHFTAGGLVAIHLTQHVRLEVDGAPVPAHRGIAVFGYDRDRSGSTRLRFVGAQGRIAEREIRLRPRSYDVQHIDGIAPRFVEPPPEAWPRIRAEARQKAAARRAQLAFWAQEFVWPLQGRVTGHYGSQRFYNGEPRRPHYGIDIAAPANSDVRASADGRVVLAAKDMYFEGGLIFLHHGLDVVSAYLHLGRIDVQPGDWVKAGQVIGGVGSGGRSTGAHLDWRVFWRHAHIDPALLVRAPLP